MFLLQVFVLECFAVIGWGLMERERLIQYPFLAASVFLGWMLPQLWGLTNHPYLPRGGLEKTIFMAILCLAATWWGYTMNNRPAKLFWWKFNRQRLLWGSAGLSLFGAYFFFKVFMLLGDRF